VIFAAAFILYGLVAGLRALRRVAPSRVVESLCAVGILIYAGTGVLAMFRGGNFLDYGALNHHDPVHGQHWGMLAIELGVGMTVAAVMITIFVAFADRERQK
jgi:multicomponent Na+:H+ antiporter subunit B